MSKNSKNIVLKVGSILLGLAFLSSGAMKLTGPAEMAANFTHWGYPVWFMYVLGALEVAGGIGLMIPSLAGLAATGLVAIMLGAVFTHVRFAEWGAVVPPVLLLTFSFLVARARRSPVLTRLGLVPQPT